jgi:uncharacterized protein YdaU (DUF1376 family)
MDQGPWLRLWIPWGSSVSSILPYYPLYVYDFDDDPNVLSMSLPEVGLYQLALNEAWKRGSIPDDPTALAVLIRRKPSDVKKAWLKVRSCWIESGTPGKLVNPRQEKERELALQKSAAASASIRKRWIDAKSDPYGRITTRSESDSVSGSSGSVRSNTDRATTRARIEPERFMRMWSDHRGFKKPSRGQRPRILEKMQTIDITEDELGPSMDGFYNSDWAKEQSYPIFAFLKDPLSWNEPATYDPPAPLTGSVPSSTGGAVQANYAVQNIDFVAIWNTDAPSAPKAGMFSAQEQRRINSIQRDEPDLADNYRDVVGRVQAICANLHSDWKDESDWFNFEWVVLKGNWGRVQRGVCNFLTRPKRAGGPGGGKGRAVDLADRILKRKGA